jgi:hypothetical protein
MLMEPRKGRLIIKVWLVLYSIFEFTIFVAQLFLELLFATFRTDVNEEMKTCHEVLSVPRDTYPLTVPVD